MKAGPCLLSVAAPVLRKMKVSLSLSPWQLVVVVELVVSSRPDHHPHCRLDSAQDYGTVCVKIPTTDCTTETMRNGVRIVTDQDCYKVVKTVCTEDTEVVNNEVCATYYEETKVQAEIKTVTASFQRVCRVEEVSQCCVELFHLSFHQLLLQVCPPVEAYGTAAGEACRYRKTRQVCYKEPRLVPLVKKVRQDNSIRLVV